MVERNSHHFSNRSELVNSNIKDQEKFYLEWMKEDLQLLGRNLFVQHFNSESIMDEWKVKGFHEEGDYDFYCNFIGGWKNFDLEQSDEGLRLKGHALKIPVALNLRCLALDIKFRINLSQHSSFYIFLRVVDSVSYETPVLKIVKDANLRGLFFVFAHLDPDTNKFKFIKQNQVPESHTAGEEDRELEIGIIDNGNDRVFVSVSSYGGKTSIKNSNFTCSGFLPETRESFIWIAGIGNGVVVRNLKMQYRERVLPKANPKKSPDCVCIVN